MKNNLFINVWFFLAILFLITGSIVGYFGTTTFLKYNYDMQYGHYVHVFTNLLIVTLITERFIDVIIGANKKKIKQGITREIKYAENSRDVANISKAYEKMDNHREEIERTAMRLGLAIGLILGLVGYSIFGAMFDISDLNSTQAKWFRISDILLTAGMVAGGSKGVNGLTSILGAFMKQSQMQHTQTSTGLNNSSVAEKNTFPVTNQLSNGTFDEVIPNRNRNRPIEDNTI